MRIREVIESHDSSSPLFLYTALQTVHQPLEVPQVGLYPIHYCPLHLSHTFSYLEIHRLVSHAYVASKTNVLWHVVSYG